MKYLTNRIKSATDRRSFIQRGLAVVGTAGVSAGLLSNSKPAFGAEPGILNPGDAAILRFLAAAELLESDLWEQYWELISGPAVTSGFEAANPATGTKPTPTGGTLRTPPLLRSWMATCPNTLMTIPMMNLATQTSCWRT
jgi:hypothetical protein